jgi:hypothetical protein
MNRRDRLAHLDLNGIIILKLDVKETLHKAVGWIHLADDREQCKALMSTGYMKS